MKLANQLPSSEWCNWLEDLAKLDGAQRNRTHARYMHWSIDKRGLMQRNLDPLYSSRKQSKHHW